MLTASDFNISMNVIFIHALHNSSVWLVKSASRQDFPQNPCSTEVFRMIKDAVVKYKRCLCFRLAKVKHVRLEKGLNFIVDNIPASAQLVVHLFF